MHLITPLSSYDSFFCVHVIQVAKMVILDEIDIEYDHVSKSTDEEGYLNNSLDSNGAYVPLKHANGVWGEQIQGERIVRERKLNLPINGCMPPIGINDEASHLDIKTQSSPPPMIVLSNRLPFVLKRNEKGTLVRKAR